MRSLATPLATVAVAALFAAVAAGCSHDESPPQTPVSQTHTTSAPVQRAAPQPDVPNAADVETPPITPDDRRHQRSQPLVPGHGDVLTPGGQYGNGVWGPSSTTHAPTRNGAFDPILDADEHGAGISGRTEDDTIPSSREPLRIVPKRDGGP